LSSQAMPRVQRPLGRILVDRLRETLAHADTRSLCMDDPHTTVVRRRLVLSNAFLSQIYRDWYAMVSASLPTGSEPILELGSGAGFMHHVLPKLITSDVFYCAGLQLVLDGRSLPMKANSLRGIVMTDVLHHVPDVRRFFEEAQRVLRPGGVISMVEPWVSPWSRFIYGTFHHEPFSPETTDWKLPPGGPLSTANGALPWVVFVRDRTTFEYEFPSLRIASITPAMPFRYAVSGGVTLRGIMPGWSYGAWRALERNLQPVMRHLAMFAHITIVRRDEEEAADNTTSRTQLERAAAVHTKAR
jgi:SAM-dependent methyltransferase